MKSSREKKTKRPMGPAKRILLYALGIAVLLGAVYLGYYLLRYVAYDRYRDFLTDYDYEPGTQFLAKQEKSPDVPGMLPVSENEALKLYTDPETAAVAVYDKRNGAITYSNPVNAEEDSIANAVNRNYLKSQFILNYYTKDVKAGIFDSYSMSVARGQVEAEAIENGIRYLYRVGDFSTSKTGNIALYITPEKLEGIISELPEKDASTFSRYYSESDTVPGMLELNGVVQKNVKTLAKMKAWLEETGWTDGDYEEQMKLAGVEAELPISFLIPLEYRLEKDSLEVSVPVSGIKEYGGGSVYRIQLLRYMGAAGKEEKGYLVVPNGSGSLIYFNNGKVNTASYTQYVYDIDPMAASYTTLENTVPVKLPLFGICRGDSGILVTMEGGSSLAMITAGVSGVYNDYNYAYPSFTLRAVDNLLMFGDAISDVYVLESEMYDVDLSVKYTFLTEENKGYAGLAGYYRQRLVEEGKLHPGKKEQDIPFYYDVIGGVKEIDHILGVQYLKTFSMTTFDQARKMAEELSGEGIGNQVMNFQGWMNDGYFHDAADKIKVLGKLGGKKKLEALSETVENTGGRFYSDVSFQKVTYADNGFHYEAEGSRYYGAGYVANFGLVDPTTLRATAGLGYRENMYSLLSPKFLPRYVEKFSKQITNYDIDGIALRDLGNTLHSDKKRTNIINREEALSVVLAQWELLGGTGKNLMADGANAYVFPYVKDIINAPVSHNQFFIVDESIPLYEMIIHGSIDYSTQVLNLRDMEDKTGMILSMVEYGAAPHYLFTWEESSDMKSTALNYFYATTYEVWKNEAMEVYAEVNGALKQVSAARMTNHKIVSSDLRKVTYSNGVCIYINYGKEPQEIDDVEIPARSFRLERER